MVLRRDQGRGLETLVDGSRSTEGEAVLVCAVISAEEALPHVVLADPSERDEASSAPVPSRPPRVFAIPKHRLAAARAACEAVIQQDRGIVRVWMPACKGGGMTYALAMLLLDAAARCSKPPQIVIYGTDDDDEALPIARAGRYPARAALGMDPVLRDRYTFDESETIRVSESLRKFCVFSRHELLKDPPMARMDLIVCHHVFEGIGLARRPELVERFHYSLRHGGLLLALDHLDAYPPDLFEHTDAGHLRARQVPARWVQRQRSSLGAGGPLQADAAHASSGENTELESVRAKLGGSGALHAIVSGLPVPLLVCNADLCVSFLSQQAMVAFNLYPADLGSKLMALAGRLPGGLDLVHAARRAVSAGTAEELSIRARRRSYVARVAAAGQGAGLLITIAFNDVTAFEATQARALVQRHRHAALARLSKLAGSVAKPSTLYEEALGALFGNLRACSAGLIVEVVGGAGQYHVMASRGLGVDPLRTLRGMADAATLLDSAVTGGCLVSQSGDRAAWEPPAAEPGARRPRSARAKQALAPVEVGLACPIVVDGLVIGVLALYARQRSSEGVDHLEFVRAMANVLGGAIAQHRTRQALALELEVSQLLGSAPDLAAVGEGLRRAFSDVLSVSAVELWALRDEQFDHWNRVFPKGEGSRRPWPARLITSDSTGTVLSSFGAERNELLVRIAVRELPTYALRVCGERLRAPDSELARVLERMGCMLGEFLERLEILRRSRRDETAYREKAAELEALYATLPVGISVHDVRGTVRHVNLELARLAHSGAGSDPLERLYAEEVPTWVSRVFASGEPIHDLELFVNAEGRTHVWLCNFAPIRAGTGTPRGVSTVVQDITKLKRIEAKLRATDQEKDDFLALLGHELRNPIAAIQSATALLDRVEQPPPRLARLRGILQRQTLQTTKLMDGLLDVARVARGKIDLSLRPVPIVELVRQVVDDRRPQFEGRELALRVPEDELWVFADRSRLIQILDNLISNSLKFTLPGGHIAVEVRQSERGALIRVEDDGLGIEPELLPRIFEPFRQGRLTRAQSRGLGLGLALVKGLVDLHGFQLSARSEGPGLGACFELDCPLNPAPEAPAPESRVDPRALDLLLVEDNADVAETLAELLTASGHRVEIAESAEDALVSLHRRRPDVVLSDIGLPGMDGLELAASVRADLELRDLKLVALTGFSDPSTRERIERAGFDRHLLKPVNLDVLRDCLARIAAKGATIEPRSPLDSGAGG